MKLASDLILNPAFTWRVRTDPHPGAYGFVLEIQFTVGVQKFAYRDYVAFELISDGKESARFCINRFVERVAIGATKLAIEGSRI